MEKGVSTHSFRASKVGNTIRKKRSRSVLSLMPWERRHQHTIKEFMRNVHNVEKSMQDPSQGSLNEVAGNFLSKGKEVATPKNSDCCIGKVLNLKENVELSPDLKNKKLGKKSLVYCEVSDSVDQMLPVRKSYPTPQNNSQGIISTNNQTLQSHPVKESVKNTDHSSSHGQALVTRSSSQNQNHCYQDVRFQVVDRKASISPCTKEDIGALNKNLKYAVQYNLDQIFTCVFPQVKTPLRQRLMYF